jgi:Carboxypeptidase regulatory-like domain
MLRRARWGRTVAQVVAMMLLPAGALVHAQSAPGYKISGTIVNSLDGTPVGQARVSLVEAQNREQAVSMVTSENGHFEFGSLPEGKFSLEGAKRGFLEAAFQQHEQFSTAIVTGAGLNTENLVLRLTPLGLLGGKVIDESGDPVRGARIRLYVERHQGGLNRIGRAGIGVTDDQGSYEFSALEPGNYYVSVLAKPWYAVHPFSASIDVVGNLPPSVDKSLDVTYPSTFYNGATDSDGATPAAVNGGDHVTVDIHLNPVPALHLLIRVASEEQPGFGMPSFQKRAFDSPESVQNEGVNQVAPGVFEMVGVPAGRYSVSTRMAASGRQLQASEINLTKDGQEWESSPSEPSGTLHVSAKMARGEPIPKELNLALRNSRRQFIAFKPLEANGEVSFEGVPPGKYAVMVNSPTMPYAVARISAQGVETAGHDVTVAAGASMEVSVSIVAGMVRVEGFAKRDGKPMSGVMIALVPKDPGSHPERFRRDQSDMDGSFALRGVLPGSYTLVAVEDAWGFPWMQPGALERYSQHGQNLTIGELMNGAVHLPDPVEVQPR